MYHSRVSQSGHLSIAGGGGGVGGRGVGGREDYGWLVIHLCLLNGTVLIGKQFYVDKARHGTPQLVIEHCTHW